MHHRVFKADDIDIVTDPRTFITTRQRSCGKVVFLVVCVYVCHSVCPQEGRAPVQGPDPASPAPPHPPPPPVRGPGPVSSLYRASEDCSMSHHCRDPVIWTDRENVQPFTVTLITQIPQRKQSSFYLFEFVLYIRSSGSINANR